MSQHNSNSIAPDGMGMLFLMSTWSPMIANLVDGWLKPAAFLLSIVLTCLAIIDYCMKIHWKLGQKRRLKEELKKEIREDAKDN